MRGFLFAALVLVGCGGSAGVDSARVSPLGGSGPDTAGAAGGQADAEPAPVGGMSSGGGGTATGGAPLPSGGRAGASGAAGAPSGGTGTAGAGGTSAGAPPVAGGGMGGSAGSAGAGGAGGSTPPSHDCPTTMACEYRPPFTVCDCTVLAVHCSDETTAAECWQVSVSPAGAGFKEKKSRLCALDWTPDCEETDAAIDAYCNCQ